MTTSIITVTANTNTIIIIIIVFDQGGQASSAAPQFLALH